MFSHRMAPPAYEADTKTDAGYLVGPALIPLVHMPFKKAVIPPWNLQLNVNIMQGIK